MSSKAISQRLPFYWLYIRTNTHTLILHPPPSPPPFSSCSSHSCFVYTRCLRKAFQSTSLLRAHFANSIPHNAKYTHTHTPKEKPPNKSSPQTVLCISFFFFFFCTHFTKDGLSFYVLYKHRHLFKYISHCVCTKVWPIVAAAATPFNILSFGISLLVCMRGARQVFSWL